MVNGWSRVGFIILIFLHCYARAIIFTDTEMDKPGAQRDTGTYEWFLNILDCNYFKYYILMIYITYSKINSSRRGWRSDYIRSANRHQRATRIRSSGITSWTIRTYQAIILLPYLLPSTNTAVILWQGRWSGTTLLQYQNTATVYSTFDAWVEEKAKAMEQILTIADGDCSALLIDWLIVKR